MVVGPRMPHCKSGVLEPFLSFLFCFLNSAPQPRVTEFSKFFFLVIFIRFLKVKINVNPYSNDEFLMSQSPLRVVFCRLSFSPIKEVVMPEWFSEKPAVIGSQLQKSQRWSKEEGKKLRDENSKQTNKQTNKRLMPYAGEWHWTFTLLQMMVISCTFYCRWNHVGCTKVQH